MKKAFKIENQSIINQLLESVEFGTLALCSNNKPYSLPINFVALDECIYFHGAKKGRKIDLIKENMKASFSVVESFSLLPSYFSTDDGSACPATQLFKSVIIDGNITLVNSFEEKTQALKGLMKKLQSEGKYTPMHHTMYEKAINATEVFKLTPEETSAKFKFGQNYTNERYERIAAYLKERGTPLDLATLELIKAHRT